MSANRPLDGEDALGALLRATASIMRDPKLPVVLRRVLDLGVDMTGAAGGAIGMLDPGGHIDHVISRTPSGDITMTPGLTAADWAAMWTAVGDVLDADIAVRGAVFGHLRLVARSGQAFDARDADLVAALVTTAGAAIESAAIHEESELRRRWLDASNDVMRELIDVGDEQPLALIVRHTAFLLSADLCGLALRLDDDHVVIKVGTPGFEHLVGRLLPGTPESLGGRALRSAEPVVGRGPFPMFSAMQPDVDISEVIAVPLVGSSEVLGVLYAARTISKLPFTPAEVDVTAGFANQAALALELARHGDDREAVKVMEDRERIAGDLHDHVIQQLFAVGVGLQSLARNAEDPAQSERVNSYVDAIDETIARIRGAISAMNTPLLGHVSLARQLQAVAVAATGALGFTPEVELSGRLDEVVDAQVIDDVVAVAREGLSNVARHAEASRAQLSVSLVRSVLMVEVVDDGRGIQTPHRSSGLKYAHRRARRHGGSFEVVAPADGGTRLVWTIPLTADDAVSAG